MVKNNVAGDASPTWKWIQPIPGVPDIGGAIGSMFKAEGSDPPKALKALFPGFGDASLRASMFAREAIANSWDAYWHSEHQHQDFELHFRFRTLTLMESRSLQRTLHLDALKQRLGEAASTKSEARRQLGLSPADCLDDLTKPLRVLEVVEHWGGGMHGAWDSGDSALERALIKVGWAQSKQGAGGSFGYGKAAVAQGSRILSVIAYSCFDPDDDDEVTRRLLGATYWNHHEVGDEKFNGWALFGDQSGLVTRPLEDEQADSVAAEIGMSTRCLDEPEEMGSTLFIVDPAFGREELEAAILCNWWPALQHTLDWRMHLFISEDDEEPTEVLAEPDHPVLGPFVRAYTAAEAVLLSTEVDTEEVDPAAQKIETSEIRRDDDVVAAVSLEEVEAASGATESLVAMMRTHRMVIRYERVGTGAPTARGVLIADEEVNESLRQTEPPEHHRWLRMSQGDNHGSPEDFQLAKLLFARLDEIATSFRRSRGPIPDARRGWTPGFSGFLGVPGEAKKGRNPKGGGGEAGTTPRPKRQIYVHLVHPDTFADVEQRPTRSLGNSLNSLRAQATVEFAISDPDTHPQLDVEFQLIGRVVEESGRGDFLPIEVEPVKGTVDIVEIESGDNGTARFTGTLRKNKPVRFNVVTSEYSDEWTVDLTFDAIVKLNDGGV